MPRSPLYEAIENEDIDGIAEAIDKGAKVDHKVLNDVIMYEDLNTLKFLVKHANNNEKSLSIFKYLSKDDNSSFYFDAISILIDAGGSLDLVEPTILNKLLLNSLHNDHPLSIIKYLIKCGAVVTQNIIKYSRNKETHEYLLKVTNQTEELSKVWLNNWVFKNMQQKKDFLDLPLGIDKFYKKKQQSYQLYRGLFWNNDDIRKMLPNLGDINYSRYTVDSNIMLDLRQLTGWSQLEWIATDFACSSLTKTSTFKKCGRYGIVLQSYVPAKNVLADVNLSLNINHEEHEIILYPGRYKCKILKLLKDGKEVKDMSLLFDLYKEGSIDES